MELQFANKRLLSVFAFILVAGAAHAQMTQEATEGTASDQTSTSTPDSTIDSADTMSGSSASGSQDFGSSSGSTMSGSTDRSGPAQDNMQQPTSSATTQPSQSGTTTTTTTTQPSQPSSTTSGASGSSSTTGSSAQPPAGQTDPAATTPESQASGATGTDTQHGDMKSKKKAKGKMKDKTSMYSPDQIREMQNALNSRGHDVGVADGVMGPNTKQALMSFQKAQNLQADGIPGQKTVEALGLNFNSDRAPASVPSTDSSSGMSTESSDMQSGSSSGMSQDSSMPQPTEQQPSQTAPQDGAIENK